MIRILVALNDIGLMLSLTLLLSLCFIHHKFKNLSHIKSNEYELIKKKLRKHNIKIFLILHEDCSM